MPVIANATAVLFGAGVSLKSISRFSDAVPFRLNFPSGESSFASLISMFAACRFDCCAHRRDAQRT